jgi:hypothetical protein
MGRDPYAVIASAAKQSSAREARKQKSAEFAATSAFIIWRASRALDCFVASLLAMTINSTISPA